MKLALVINELNIKGGTHKQLINLTHYLSASGHEVRIYTKHYSPEMYPLSLPNVKVISYEKFFTARSGKLTKYMNFFLGSIRMGSDISNWAELVNIHDNWLLIPNIYIKIFSPSKKVVWQINDLHPAFAIGNSKDGTSNWYNGFVKMVNRWVAKQNDVITVNVTKNKERVQQFLHCNAEVIYCGVDIKNQSLVKHMLNKQKTIHLLSVGVFFRYRNYETVLQVHEELSRQYGLDVKTTIAGSTKLAPDYGKEIKNIIQQKGLNAQVLGEVTDSELDALFNEAHFFLFLNIDQSWGLAVFEAMNYGLPIIVSQSVGAVELLDDSNAVIAAPLDAKQIATEINSLVNDELQYDRLAQNAFSHVSAMTWDKMYSRNVEAIFYKLLDRDAV